MSRTPSDEHPVVVTAIEVQDQFAQDIITTAIEGGSNYWITEGPVNEVDRDAKGDPVRVRVVEDIEGADPEGQPRCVVDVTNTKEAIRQVLAGEVGVAHRVTMAILDGDVDAETADVIFQVAALGEIRYA